MSDKKTALIILDGWGIGDASDSDVIAKAETPVYDKLMATYPNSRLKTYGENVGLPNGQMGNSEVGHINIGAGRVVYQDLVRVNKAIEDDTLKANEVLLKAIQEAEQKNVAIHLMGLVSHGGVHSSQKHLHGLVDILDEKTSSPVYIHAFTDGRDTAPRNAADCMKELQAHLEGKNAKLVSMIGRYYAMDRDKRWERIKIAYDLLLNGVGEQTSDFVDRCHELYDENITDEFFTPSITSSREGRIKAGDVVICFNFRTDRCRQITTALTQQDFPDWKMDTLPLHYVTMTRYDESFKDVEVLFEKDNLSNTLGEVLANAGLSQLRIAETEKYPHVTFFFSGGREACFEGEQRLMIDSPKVATYDLQPEMSAHEVTAKVTHAMTAHSPNFICLNFANPDMVGHTGVYSAIKKAVETTDECLGQVFETGRSQGYSFIIIADHGNADKAFEANGSPHTAHTTNPVPCIVVADGIDEVKDGILADIAPSICQILGLKQPDEMTGQSIIK